MTSSRHQVARKVFVLVVALIMIPATLTAGFAWWTVHSQVTATAEARLRESAKTYGMNLRQRLLVLDETFAGIIAGFEEGQLSPQRLNAQHLPLLRSVHFHGLGADAAGLPPPVRDVIERRSAMLPGPIDRTRIAIGPSIHTGELYLIRGAVAAPSGPGFLFAEVDPDFLWGRASYFPFGLTYCVMARSGVAPFCPDGDVQQNLALVRNAVRGKTTGRFAIPIGDTRVIAGYWNVFLSDSFVADEFMVAAFQKEADAFAGIAAFERFLPRILGFAAFAAIWLALAMIRRRLRPLNVLTRAAGRIAAGDFSSSIRLNTRDEFNQLGAALNEMRRRLGRQFTALNALAEVDEMILKSRSVDPIAEHVAVHLLELAQADCVWVMLLERDAQNLAKTFFCVDGEIQTTRGPVPLGKAGTLVQEAEGRVVDLEDNPSLAFCCPYPDVTECIVFPIRQGERLLGLIGVAGWPGKGLRKRDRRSAQEFADRIAVAAASLEREERLFAMGHYDDLTGLPNRQLLKVRLQDAIGGARQAGGMGALLFIDLDGFKRVNDSEGHTTGDEMLGLAAERIAGCVRDGDTVARLGGDEFTVLMDGIRTTDSIDEVCARVLDRLQRPFVVNTLEHFVSASIGICLYPEDGDTVEEILRNADTAMYVAKEQGGGKSVYFRPSMNERAQRRVIEEADLRRALGDSQMALHYQPQICIETGRVVGAEALLRWLHPEHGAVTTAEFIQLAEDTGFIVELGRWALQSACRQYSEWRGQGLALDSLSVNVSVRQIREPDFLAELQQIVHDTGIPPAALELEVTESLLADDINEIQEFLRRVHEMGLRVAIDDFGTGYSSLGYLKRFPVDTIKIDRTFLMDVPDNPESTEIVGAIVGLARSLNKSTVAEGVETEAQLDYLQEIGCPTAQGFLFAEALPPPEFCDYTLRRNGRDDELRGVA